MKQSPSFQEIIRLSIINKLKSVYRLNSVDKRKESSAEHSWSCIVLADYILNKYKIDVDRLKVYELLMYHDLSEIHTGDFPFIPGADRGEKKDKELLAAKKLEKELPEQLGKKYYEIFTEFEEQKTNESRFAKAIDILDAQIHEIDYKEDWKGWTKDFLLNNKRSECFNYYPELKEEFLNLLNHLEQEGYFNQ